MASIRLDHLSKVYSTGHMAVRDFDLDIADGELVVLVGPSGCGKTTVLRMVAGLEPPTQGRVFIADDDVTQRPPQDRDLAMVFQNYALYPHQTVRENLAFGLRMRRVRGPVIAERVKRVAESLELAQVLDRKPSALSGGQRQRVALGRAIVREPRAFLLDEPLSNLDATLRRQMRSELSRLHRQLGATMLYVTHDQEEAMTLGDRIAVMRDGQIQQVGSPLDVYRRPVNRFVAGFVGSPAMNFVPCRLSRHATGSRLESSSFSFDIDAVGDPQAACQEVRLGVRPSDVRLVHAAQGDVVGRVDVIESLGSVRLVHLVLAGAGSRRLVVVESTETAVALSELVGARFARDRLHLFDAHTERRLNAT